MRDLPISELMKRCRDQDPGAWNEIVERHRRLVYSVPLRLGLPADEASEVFQGVFESLLRNLDQLRETERISSWLYTAARRLSLRRLSALRRQGREENREEEVLEQVATQEGSVSDRLEEAERRGHLLRLVENISERCRALLEALFLDPDEPDYDAIALRLRIPRGSIGPTRQRCLAKLYVLMEEQGYPFRTP
jgi:RNA polymerase sigma factor (sigma-70 family)